VRVSECVCLSALLCVVLYLDGWHTLWYVGMRVYPCVCVSFLRVFVCVFCWVLCTLYAHWFISHVFVCMCVPGVVLMCGVCVSGVYSGQDHSRVWCGYSEVYLPVWFSRFDIDFRSQSELCGVCVCCVLYR